MRKFVPLLFFLTALAVAGVAQAAVGPSSTLQVSADRVLYGNHVTITGRVSNHESGQRVAIVVRPYGETSLVVTVISRSDGFWTFRPAPTKSTTYQARIDSRMSPALAVGVQPRVTIDELGNGRISARVDGARSFRGNEVALQRLQANGQWETVQKHALGPSSGATFTTTLPSSTVRISMSVNQAGLGYLGTASHSMLYHNYKLTLTPSAYRVVYGGMVTLTGRLQNGHSGERVTINRWPYGASSPVVAAVVRTTKNGEWTYRARPTIATAYQALWARTELSPRRTIGVTPRISISTLHNGHVLVKVAAGRSLKGQEVQLQRKTGSTWTTLGKQPLLSGSVAMFVGDIPTATLRAAISVNQAGVGYLGAITNGMAYRSAQ